MAWELEIHIIDVGQGESSLIIAKDPAVGPPHNYRSMLIDGGLPGQAETVHNYVAAQTQGIIIDSIVTTHYDVDHSGGITNLLIADNRHIQNDILAIAAAAAATAAATAPVNNTLLNQISAAAAAVAAAGLGAYDDENGNDYTQTAVAAGEAGQALPVAGLTADEAARNGAIEGENHIELFATHLHKDIVSSSTYKRRQVAIGAGIAAGMAGGGFAARRAAAYDAVHNELLGSTPNGSQFRTNGLYHDANIIDVGDHIIQCPADYEDAIDGSFTMYSNRSFTVPNTSRLRTAPALGDEILWNSGIDATPAPPGAPAVYVAAINRHVRSEPAGTPAFVGSPENRISLGLIIRFNNFFYFTGGDLPFEGEDRMLAFLLGQAHITHMRDGAPNPVVAIGLANPNPPPANFPVPNHICCFKCSHHGSSESTSDYFVNNSMARAAFISAGEHTKYLHPNQSVIDALHNSARIRAFYLTNCHYQRNHVPGWDPLINQLTVLGNKSRISGDNDQTNLNPLRNRGNITILVDEAGSLSVTHPPAPPAAGAVHHSFSVRYWDEDRPGGAGFRVVRYNH
jgi:hypothetical protein